MEKGEMEEIKRHFGVVAEGLRSEIRQVAEGHDAIREEIKRFREEVKEEFKEVEVSHGEESELGPGRPAGGDGTPEQHGELRSDRAPAGERHQKEIKGPRGCPV